MRLSFIVGGGRSSHERQDPPGACRSGSAPFAPAAAVKGRGGARSEGEDT